MASEIESLKTMLCKSLCADVAITERTNGLLLVNTPFTFSDGDSYTFVLERLTKGGFRVTDAGTTLMHMSYENDLGKFREGARGKLLEQIIAETGLIEDDGEFYMDASSESLGRTVFQFGQAMTRIHDLTFLLKRMETTFTVHMEGNA